ncbi:hypothetical protein Tco_1076045 [Tanacetum coccineum]
MCARVVSIIPGLLRSRNALEESLHAMAAGNRRPKIWKVRIEWSSNPYLSRESLVLQVIVTETLSHWPWMVVECWKTTWDDVPVAPSNGRESGCQMRLNSASIYRFQMVYGVTD